MLPDLRADLMRRHVKRRASHSHSPISHDVLACPGLGPMLDPRCLLFFMVVCGQLGGAQRGMSTLVVIGATALCSLPPTYAFASKHVGDFAQNRWGNKSVNPFPCSLNWPTYLFFSHTRGHPIPCFVSRLQLSSPPSKTPAYTSQGLPLS